MWVAQCCSYSSCVGCRGTRFAFPMRSVAGALPLELLLPGALCFRSPSPSSKRVEIKTVSYLAKGNSTSALVVFDVAAVVMQHHTVAKGGHVPGRDDQLVGAFATSNLWLTISPSVSIRRLTNCSPRHIPHFP